MVRGTLQAGAAFSSLSACTDKTASVTYSCILNLFYIDEDRWISIEEIQMR